MKLSEIHIVLKWFHCIKFVNMKIKKKKKSRGRGNFAYVPQTP